jgi:hypothetical protein
LAPWLALAVALLPCSLVLLLLLHEAPGALPPAACRLQETVALQQPVPQELLCLSSPCLQLQAMLSPLLLLLPAVLP